MTDDSQAGVPRDTTNAVERDGHRRPRRRSVLAGLGTTALAGLAGCASLLPASETAGDRTVTDTAGRTVDVPDDPERILGIGAGTLRQLAFMDATDRVVGIGSVRESSLNELPYLVANPELGELPTFGDRGADRDGDAEQILEVEPDVIFLNGDSSRADELAEQTNTPVVLVDTENILTGDGRKVLYQTWKTIGETLRNEDRADALETFLEDTITDFDERTGDIPADERAEGYAAAFRFRGAHGLSTTRGDTTMFHYPNVENAIEDVESHQNSVDLSHEQLLEADPERIFIDVASVDRVREEVDENPEFEALTAVKEGEVYPVLQVYRDMRNFGPMIANAYFVGKTAYPDRFADVDLESQVDDVFEALFGERIYSGHLNAQFPDVYRPLF
ncbi:ABC transporter substrate-binding protein [Natronorubrum bangense]|uniref:Periplasmic binding protein n=2 Tax=Natronorubrum bangense TaxID=61858 RepID=L9WR47_9EURY|nr:ABC transporter substrate-binding protein [Natronorubrum bangense]ELY51945.1 periplasmic binding protein [Natronorubrum bangense JCM 10635]QCC54834.1 ABC transporter substrate-binding protein [Natronorubrum bangense]